MTVAAAAILLQPNFPSHFFPMPKFPTSKMAQYVIRNPFTTAAAVFAPIFAQNEDRGYFRTALITTPVIFATGEFVPKLFGSVRDLGHNVAQADLLKKAERHMRWEEPNFHTLHTIFKEPGVSQNTIERNLSAYLVSERRSRDFLKEQKSLDRLFKRSFVKTSDLIGQAGRGDKLGLAALRRLEEIETLQATKGRLITNAMHVARRSSLTPLEWNKEPSGIPPTPADINEYLLNTYNEFRGRPEFVRTLKNRLRDIKKLNYSGTLLTSDWAPVGLPTMSTNLVFGFGDPMEIKLKAQAPELYEYLQSAEKNRFARKITIEAEQVTSGEIGRLLNVRVLRKGNTKDLIIPLVDPATGQVRLGPNAIGVGNYVIDQNADYYRIDAWIAKMIAERDDISNAALEEEIAAHAYWRAGDPLDARRVSELNAIGGEGALTMNARAIKLRSYGAGITKLPLFQEGDHAKSFYDFEFSAPEKVGFIRKLLNSNKYVAMGSEAGIYEGRFQLREALNLSPLGAPSAEKQDPLWRSLTKEFSLSAPEGLPESARINWRSTAWDSLMGTSDLPLAKFTVAGISPQDRTLFSELPRTLDELHFNRAQIVQSFVERGMTPQKAAEQYNELYQMYTEGRQGILGYLGGMGETGFVMDPTFANNFQVEGMSKYNVDEIGVKVGDVLDTDTLIGFNNGERVAPKFTGEVTDIARDGEGFVVNMKHMLPMQGAKLDIGGVKGMNRVTEQNEHFGQLRDLMNNFYERMGTGDRISSEVNLLAPAEYFTEKVEPAHAYLGIGQDLVERLQREGVAQDATAQYLASMRAAGIDYSSGQFVIDASRNVGSDFRAANRLTELSAISEEFFAKAGDALRTAGGYHDPVLDAFVHQGKDIGNFMMKNQLPAIGATWDHSLANAPRFMNVSYDVETHMALSGRFAGLKALRSRMQTTAGGSPEQARQFLEHVLAGNFSKPFGNVVAIKDAFLREGSLNLAATRAGSIFDPSIEAYKGNFSLDLGNGTYLPVPGTGAYGAEAPMYGPGEYQTRSWQNAVRDLAAADPEERAELQNRVLNLYKKEFGIGKGSALRPYQYDPLSVPGFLSTAAEQGDPFVARVSRQWAERVHSGRLRKALLQGEDVAGMLFRQPINEAMYMKYRLDESLNGTLDVAVPEAISRAYMGDQDKDLVNNILFDANLKVQDGKLVVADASSQVEREAAEEAIAHMARNGLQEKQLATWQDLKGTAEIAKEVKDFELTSLAERSQKFAKAVGNRIGVAVNRTAGAAIGAYSNVLTGMTEQLARNPRALVDADFAERLKTALFDIRQAPISARKAHLAFSLETAMQNIDNLRRGVSMSNPDAAAAKIQEVMLNMTRTLNKAGEKSDEYLYWAGQGAEDLKLWAQARSEKARLASALFTTRGEGPQSERALDALQKAFKVGLEDVIGPVHGGKSAATESATRLGAMAEGLANIGREAGASVVGDVGKIFSKHGKAMALGLGALAALGVALTPRTAPVASFSRSSGNSYRPEERMGVSDNVPGEPVPGQMAPGTPPRRIVQGAPGVRTSVVAPMAQTSDLVVRMKAEDQARAAETARQLSMIPGSGATNVTVNYRDRTKIGSLRTRERIRELNR